MCQGNRENSCTWERFLRRPQDTDPAVEALDRGLPPDVARAEARAGSGAHRAVQELALLDIRRRHPDADEREQALRLASRWIEPELMVRAFGWDVRKVGY